MTDIMWPPRTAGTYRIRNLSGKCWQLSENDGDGPPRVVELKDIDASCNAQKWVMTPVRAFSGVETKISDSKNFNWGAQVNSSLYSIVCVEDDAALVADNHFQFSGEYINAPKAANAASSTITELWHMKAMALNGLKYTTIYPTEKRQNGFHFLRQQVCDSKNIKQVGGQSQTIVYFVDPTAIPANLTSSQGWFFEVVD